MLLHSLKNSKRQITILSPSWPRSLHRRFTCTRMCVFEVFLAPKTANVFVCPLTTATPLWKKIRGTTNDCLYWHYCLFIYQRFGPDSLSVLEITAVGGLFWWFTFGMENWMERCELGTIYTPTQRWWRTNTARESQGVLRRGKFAITLIIAS